MSSTGHLIVVGSLLDWNDEKGELFEIVIQFAAILAVCWQYRQRLWTVVATLPREAKSQRFTLNLVLAFLPAAVLGVIFISTDQKVLVRAGAGRHARSSSAASSSSGSKAASALRGSRAWMPSSRRTRSGSASRRRCP